MKIALSLVDDRMPRTVFHDKWVEAVRRNRRFAGLDVAADVVLPAEDISQELNWPRYGRMESAYIRGALDEAQYRDYVNRFVNLGSPCCLVNMHPFIRFPQIFAQAGHAIVADGNLHASERAANHRTISMPAMPIVVGPIATPPRSVTASFRGVRSHPCRDELERLANGRDIVCQIVERENHFGRLDATSGQTDPAYADLLAKSVFAFVPRGDSLFSYRLLEAMSFGCIPIVISDGWVLPFDRLIEWQSIALHPGEGEIARIPQLLANLPADKVAQWQREVAKTYAETFSSFDAIAEALFQEIELLLARPDGSPAQHF